MFKVNRNMLLDNGDGGGDQPPADGDNNQQQPPASPKFEKFEDFLKAQPPEILELYQADVHGLKTALEKERKAKAPNIPEDKLKKFEEWMKSQDTENDPIVQLEKLRAEKQVLEQNFAKKDAEFRELMKERSFDDAMTNLDLWFVNETAQNDAYGMLEQYKLGDKFENMEDAIKQLTKDRPHLFLAPKKDDDEDTTKSGSKTKEKVKSADSKKRETNLKQRFRF